MCQPHALEGPTQGANSVGAPTYHRYGPFARSIQDEIHFHAGTRRGWISSNEGAGFYLAKPAMPRHSLEGRAETAPLTSACASQLGEAP